MNDYLSALQLLEERGGSGVDLHTGWDVGQHREAGPHAVVVSMPSVCCGRLVSDEAAGGLAGMLQLAQPLQVLADWAGKSVAGHWACRAGPMPTVAHELPAATATGKPHTV
jgi:hypothetical protein